MLTVSQAEELFNTRYAAPHGGANLRADIVEDYIREGYTPEEAAAYFERNREELLKFGAAAKAEVALLRVRYGSSSCLFRLPDSWQEAWLKLSSGIV